MFTVLSTSIRANGSTACTTQRHPHRCTLNNPRHSEAVLSRAPWQSEKQGWPAASLSRPGYTSCICTRCCHGHSTGHFSTLTLEVGASLNRTPFPQPSASFCVETVLYSGTVCSPYRHLPSPLTHTWRCRSSLTAVLSPGHRLWLESCPQSHSQKNSNARSIVQHFRS